MVVNIEVFDRFWYQCSRRSGIFDGLFFSIIVMFKCDLMPVFKSLLLLQGDVIDKVYVPILRIREGSGDTRTGQR